MVDCLPSKLEALTLTPGIAKTPPKIMKRKSNLQKWKKIFSNHSCVKDLAFRILLHTTKKIK
jgi:hypothetical protein